MGILFGGLLANAAGAVVGLGIGVIGIPMFLLTFRDFLRRRIVAETPTECWERLELIEPAERSENDY